MLTSFKLQQYDEVGNADADDAGEGAAADVEISIATQGSNILHLLQENLQTLNLCDIMFHNQGMLQRSGQRFQVLMSLLCRHCGEIWDRYVVICHEYKRNGIDNLLNLIHVALRKEKRNCHENACNCGNLAHKKCHQEKSPLKRLSLGIVTFRDSFT